MQILKTLIAHLVSERRFFYTWEQQEFERRREQQWQHAQFSCRSFKD